MKKRFAGMSIHASVLAFCAVLAMRFPHAVAAEPPPPPPPPPVPGPQFPGTGSFQSRLVMLTDDGLLTRAYEAGIRQRYADSGTLEADVRLALDSAIAGTPPYLHTDVGDGEFEGAWEFVATPGSWPPARAWRDIDRSGADGYAAERVGYCRGSRSDCGKWFEAGRHHSRSPRFGSGDRAETEWANRVMEEPCRRGPEFKPAYDTLQGAISSSGLAEAEVHLTALLNPCGDVRDVWVAKSSRNRDIDRAAIAWARGARFTSVLERLGTLGRRGTLGRLPFTFVAE